MSRRFRGESTHKVDSKGRVSIPAGFRRVLEACDPDWREGDSAGVVIAYGDHRRDFLECYTIEAIQDVERRISKLPRRSKKRIILERLYTGNVVETTVDETGRLVLPAKVRNKIGLENEAYFIAATDTFQIWKPETYEEVESKKTEEWLDELPDDFDPLEWLEDDEEDMEE